MSIFKAKEKALEQPDDAPYRSLMCQVPGCPDRWCVELGGKRRCSRHTWQSGAVGRVNASQWAGESGGRGWARRLKAMHESGEPLTATQIEMYRRALREPMETAE